MEQQNLNCLSYWYPKLLAAELPVPKTIIVKSPGGPWELAKLLDGEKPDGFDDFISELITSADSIGFPIFLRTGLGSGKHHWKDCCYVADREQIVQHVYNLVEWSHLVDMMGLQHDVWAVREMLPTMPLGVCDGYGGMPVCREFRFFVRSFPKRVRVARVIEEPGFIREMFTIRDGLDRDSAVAHNDSLLPPPFTDHWWTNDSFSHPDVLSKIYQDFGLSEFDSQIREKGFRNLGCALRSSKPIPQGLSIFDIFAFRCQPWCLATEKSMQNVDSISADLLDLNERRVADASKNRPSGRLLSVDGKTSISIQQSGTVGKFVAFCFHESYDTATTGERNRYVYCTEIEFATEVSCAHPYWPLDALVEGGFAADVPEGWYEKFLALPLDYNLHDMASKAGAAVGGSWSVDILETQRGFFVTDMAEANRSWHWPDCAANKTGL